MKIKFLLPVIAIASLASCSDGSTKNPPGAAENTPDSAKVHDSTTAYCYSSTRKRDTVLLHININGEKVQGELEYNLYEKDRNKGDLEGVLKGDTLIANYKFLSEGVESVRQVVFLKKGNDLIEGFGESEEKNGKIMFKDIRALNFDNSFILQKVDCKN